VTKRLRLPIICTAVAAAATTGAHWLAQGVLGESSVNLELDGIDALDVNEMASVTWPLTSRASARRGRTSSNPSMRR
jgi:hypothetical protein